jgi:succinate dehydrogenase/fumarate reductase flavoprotein subunit
VPEALGGSLVGVAHEAFAQSFELVAAVSACLLVALAIIAGALLRREGSHAESERQPEPVALPAR